MKLPATLAALLILVCLGLTRAEAQEAAGDLRHAARLVTLPEAPIDPKLDPDWLVKAEQVLAKNHKPWVLIVRTVTRKPGSLDRPDPNQLRSLRELLWIRGRVALVRGKQVEVLQTANAMILLSAHVGREGNFADGLRAMALSSSALELLERTLITRDEDLDTLEGILKLPVTPSLGGLCQAEAKFVAKHAPGEVETFAEAQRDWKSLQALSAEERIKRVDALFRTHADQVPYQRILRSLLDLEQKHDSVRGMRSASSDESSSCEASSANPTRS